MTITHLSGDAFLSLVGQQTTLKCIARAGPNGGEWEGPCPFCKAGRNRFRVQPNVAGGGRWWCRQCRENDGWAKDIDYILLRNHGFIPTKDHPDWPDFFRDAARELGLVLERGAAAAGEPLDPAPPEPCEPPPPAWQAAALSFVEYSFDQLWARPHQLDILRRRGLTDRTISAAAIGYNPGHLFRPPAKWGLDRDKKIALPAGFVFPWFVGGALWKLNVRQDHPRGPDDPKYITIPGSGNAAYGIDTVAPGRPAVIVEGVVDALAVLQAAGQFGPDLPLCGVAGVGTTGGRHFPWIIKLALASRALVALDDDPAGDKAAPYWLDVLKSNAVRLRPTRHDPGEMLERGDDLVAWIRSALASHPKEARHVS